MSNVPETRPVWTTVKTAKEMVETEMVASCSSVERRVSCAVFVDLILLFAYDANENTVM